MVIKAVAPKGARELGRDSPPDLRPDLTLGDRSEDTFQDRSGGRRWEYKQPNLMRNNNLMSNGRPRPSYRKAGVIVEQPTTFGRVTQPRAGNYGAQIVRRSSGSPVGTIVYLT